MKKITKICSISLLAGCILASGCGQKPAAGESDKAAGSQPESTAPLTSASSTETPLDEQAIRAMYLEDPSGNGYFVDINVGTFFTAPIPEGLKDASGNVIAPDSLTPGAVLDIYGNGIMLESYPGQYPGVTQMTLVEAGTAEDAAKYQYLIDEIYTEPDPSQIPYMSAEYATELTLTSASLTNGSYHWNYTDKEGNAQSVIADSPHILEWPQLADLNIQSPLELTLMASMKPDAVKVTRWPVSFWSGSENAEEISLEEAIPQGETVETKPAGEFLSLSAEPGYVYLVEASWGESTVEYGFYTK